MTVEADLAVGTAFLAPVLQRESIIKAKGKSILDILDPGEEENDDQKTGVRERVITKALSILLNIHDALCHESSSSASSDVLGDLKSRRIIDGLLDLVSLEGIYPSLSPGIGVPIERRVKSVLQGGVVTRSSSAKDDLDAKDKELLIKITDRLNQVAAVKAVGLGPALHERSFVDLVAGLGELAYNPSYADEKSRSSSGVTLKELLDAVPAAVLFPTLTSLIQPATPLWFRSRLSTFLSLMPLRPNGVQQTISFIASTATQAQQDPTEQRPNSSSHISSPILSLEVLSQASKLLAAVPSSLTVDAYFSILGPQLLHLLDCDDIEMKRAASYIIGNGILGRRKYGSPGTVGWDIFAQPILEAINPQKTAMEALNKCESIGYTNLGKVVVSETSLRQALNRLSSLTLMHPNPGLTKRLITPSLLPLWGLWCYSKEKRRSSWIDDIYELFCVYFKTAAGVEQFIRLTDQLQWSGGDSWRFGPGQEGGIEVRGSLAASNENSNVVTMVHNIDSRIDELMRLLGAGALDNDSINTVFLHASKHWLLDSQRAPGRNSLHIGDESVHDPLLLLVHAKIAQKILQEYKDKLAANPSKIIEFVGQLLAAFVTEHRNAELKTSEASRPSIAGLSRISSPEMRRSLEAEDGFGATGENFLEIVSIALNLLSTILSSSDLSRAGNTVDLVDVQSNLSYLATSQALPASVVLAASNVLALTYLQYQTTSPIPDTTSARLDQYDSDLRSHSLALKHLVDPLPPVRAQALSLLTELVGKTSPILDISSTAILFVSLLEDEDEFVYLSAIRALGLLASRHPRTVIKMLIENYVDTPENKGLDARVKIGEALLKTVESLCKEFVGETARLVGEGMIAVASRRGIRTQKMEARAQKLQNEDKAIKEAEKAWGGNVPTIEDEVEDETNGRLAEIVKGWEGSQGEEDVRIRTSALSILGVALETNVAGIGSSIVSTAVDLVLAILKLEITNEKAILRRAAVRVIMSLVKALDAANEAGRKLGFGFAGENLVEVISVLRYIEMTDSDDLVIGHVREVIEGMETWQSKTILGLPRPTVDLNTRTSLQGGQLAGLSVVPEASTVSRHKIEEVE